MYFKKLDNFHPFHLIGNPPGIDPFHNINPLIDGNTAESQQLQAICGLTLAEKQIGYSWTVDNDSDDSDWERSAFDAFNEMDG